LGHKSLAVNVSDVAAMGGLPVAAFINLTVSPEDDLEWLLALYDGFEDVARAHNFTVAGGDISRGQETVIGVTVLGNAPRPILRSGALVGDALIVTGPLGDAAAGLWLLQNPAKRLDEQTCMRLLTRHHEPVPCLAAMQAVLNIEGAVHAALDISDGLAGDAAHLARASGVAVEIRLDLLPYSVALRAAAQCAAPQDAIQRARDWALYGGEDYELLLAVASEKAEAVCTALQAYGAQAMVIGVCTAGEGVWLCEGDAAESAKKMRPTQKAWTHF
jgi:thiamine-monophosphate kinase